MTGDEIKVRLEEIGKSQAELARFLGMEPDKLSKTLSGKRRAQVGEIALIQRFLKLHGKRRVNDDEEGVYHDSDFDVRPRRATLAIANNSTIALRPIPELDMSLGGATGGAVQHYYDPDSEFLSIDRVDVRLEWQVPADWVSGVPAPGEKRLFIMPVLGCSMSPEFNPGDRVLVNAADRRPSPAGTFVVWDGLSLVIKLVNYIPHSNPPRVQLISRDSDIPTYERTLDEAFIQGRVVGKWDWH